MSPDPPCVRGAAILSVCAGGGGAWLSGLGSPHRQSRPSSPPVRSEVGPHRKERTPAQRERGGARGERQQIGVR